MWIRGVSWSLKSKPALPMSGGPKTFCGAKELADQKKVTKVKNYVTLQVFALCRLGIKTDFRDLRGTPPAIFLLWTKFCA